MLRRRLRGLHDSSTGNRRRFLAGRGVPPGLVLQARGDVRERGLPWAAVVAEPGDWASTGHWALSCVQTADLRRAAGCAVPTGSVRRREEPEQLARRQGQGSSCMLKSSQPLVEGSILNAVLEGNWTPRTPTRACSSSPSGDARAATVMASTVASLQSRSTRPLPGTESDSCRAGPG